MNKKKGYMTLAEHDAQLKAEGKWQDFVERQDRQQAEREQLWDAVSASEGPIVEDLKKIGIHVQSVWDLVGMESRAYSEAISILLKHVQEKYPERILEGILRALATPAALKHWGELLNLFEFNSAKLPSNIRYLAAVALNGAADDSVINDILRLAADARFGVDRAPLLLTLERSRDPRAKMLLLKLREDKEIGKEVRRMRRILRLRAPVQ
jgi:hypothetical protein